MHEASHKYIGLGSPPVGGEGSQTRVVLQSSPTEVSEAGVCLRFRSWSAVATERDSTVRESTEYVSAP